MPRPRAVSHAAVHADASQCGQLTGEGRFSTAAAGMPLNRRPARDAYTSDPSP